MKIISKHNQVGGIIVKKSMIFIVALTVFGGIGTAQNVASGASKAAKVISTKNLKNSKVHLSKGYIYSTSKLTKVSHNGQNYTHTTFTRYSQITVKKSNGKQAVYQYIRAGKVKGWVWHSYLKSGAAPSSTYKVTAANLKTFQKAFLSYMNKERAQRGLYTYKEDPDLDKVAAVRAQQLTVTFNHVNALGQTPFEVGKSMGVDFYAENIFDDFTGRSSWNAVAKEEVHTYIYDDADSNWGHRDTMLSKDYKALGNGIAIKDGRLYTAQDYA